MAAIVTRRNLLELAAGVRNDASRAAALRKAAAAGMVRDKDEGKQA